MTAGLDIIDLLDFTLGVVDMKADVGGLPALKLHFVNQVKANDFGVDAIYFSGEYPSVYFKAVPDFQEPALKKLLAIQRKIWNQGKVPFLYAESPFEIRVYNCYEKPRKEVKDADEIELYRASKKAVEDLNLLKEVFNKVSIETGNFWKKDDYAKLVKNDTRVDKALIESLKNTREILKGKGLTNEVIHDLLLRSLFLLYLEDRGATDTRLYEGRENYFKVLEDKEAAYSVYEKLDDRFNGNLCPVTKTEKALVTNDHLAEIRNCFYSGRTLFFGWRYFDFKVIPIQLISEIYEHFLSDEIGTEEKNASGTFYTPHPLSEFVLNEVLPHASIDNSKYDIKILDITCGSGIFLVESLNRLLDRWQFANKGKNLNFETICQIVKDNVFGIEKEKEAIKVAAFSIYLAMLDRLEPKILWQNKRFPYLIYEPDEQDADKQGHNLFRMSSLGYEEDKSKQGRKKKYFKKVEMPFEGIEYDLIVGNPPFGGRKVKPDVRAYLEKHGFGNETVEAFFHRATELCPEGKIALISTSKVLFNTGDNHQNFRRFLFNDCYVDKVYNFSILRRVPQSRGRNLFASTVRPISVFFYSAEKPEQQSDRLMYCAPTTAIKNRIIDGIAIDPTDVKYLPREECQKPDTKIWKAAMWGTERDFSLFKLHCSKDLIKETISQNKWNSGVGFQVSKPLKYINYEIQKLQHLPPDKLERYYTKIEKTTSIIRHEFRRLGCIDAYNSPHLIIKRGQENNRLCASFIDYAASFKSIVFGIHAFGEEDNLKLLSAYLNSDLATYLTFLSSSSWGIEREIVYPEEILDLPDLSFSLSSETKKQIVSFIDKIIAIRKKEPTEKVVRKKTNQPSLFDNSAQEQVNISHQITELEQKIESALWDALNLSETDKVLIEDLLDYQLDAFQSGQKSKAFNHCEIDDTKAYAQYLCKTINDFLSYTPEVSVWASVFDIPESTPLNVVILHFNSEQKPATIHEHQSNEINQVLQELERYTYQEHSESIYYRKFLRYYNDDIVYLVKPNEKRFWSRSMGLNDADEITLEILTTEHERESQ